MRPDWELSIPRAIIDIEELGLLKIGTMQENERNTPEREL
jgi:hypothetical protein